MHQGFVKGAPVGGERFEDGVYAVEISVFHPRLFTYSVDKCNSFYVSGVGKTVDRRGGGDLELGISGQLLEIAGQGGRVAGHLNEAFP